MSKVLRDCDIVIFDGDNTLWHCVSPGVEKWALSDQGDGPGSPHYRYEQIGERLIRRTDICAGESKRATLEVRFELFPDVIELLNLLRAADRHISLASYNYPEPVFSALEAFGIRDFFEHPLATWTPRKDLMVELIIAAFETDRRIAAQEEQKTPTLVERDRVVLVDDGVRYFEDARRTGIQFFQVSSPEDLSRLASEIVPH
jgi:predicted phosphatase